MNELNELATALAAAQGEIMPAPKDADNPFFKSKYSSLPAIREAVREVFAKNGLSVIQCPSVVEGRLELRTVLLHSSGQSFDCGVLAAEVDVANPQKAGSAISYFRRYALAAVSGCVSDEDDDAEAVRAPSRKPLPKKVSKKQPVGGHEVVALQQLIQETETKEALSETLRGDTYKRLKSDGPADVYEQTRALAEDQSKLIRDNTEKPF